MMAGKAVAGVETNSERTVTTSVHVVNVGGKSCAGK
jgi:hypothetical protein